MTELKKLRKALAFYAKPENYKRGVGGIGMRRGTPSKVQRDGGDRARKALANR